MFNRALKDLALVVLGLAVGIAIRASHSEGLKLVDDPQVKLEVALGQGRFQKSPDGMWRQDPYENASRYKDNHSSEIGFAFRLTERYGMSVRWVNPGHITTSARAETCPEDNCKLTNRAALFREECAHKDVQHCVQLWEGGGGVHGVNIAFNTELARIGQVSLDGELGAFAYEMYWVAKVYPLACKDHSACEWSRTDKQESGLYLSPMLGLTARWKGLFVATRYYTRTTEHTSISPGFSGGIQTWLVGGSLPLPKAGGTTPSLSLSMNAQPMGVASTVKTYTIQVSVPL